MRTLRTNRVGATINVLFSGTDHIGVRFSNTFRAADNGTYVPGRIAYRVYAEADFPSQKPFRYAPADGNLVCAERLNTATDYVLEIVVDRLAAFQRADSSVPLALERYREWSQVPLDSATGPFGAFVEVAAILGDPAMTLSLVGDTSALVPQTKALIIGCGMADGQLLDIRGHDVWDPFYVRSDLGVRQSYIQQAAHLMFANRAEPDHIRYAARPDASGINLSGEAFPWTFSDNTTYRSETDFRTGTGINLDTGATVAREPYYGYAGWIYNDVVYHAINREVASAYAPDIIFVDLGIHDQTLNNPNDPTWYTKFGYDMYQLIQLLNLKWPAAVFVLVKPHVATPGYDVDPLDAVFTDIEASLTASGITYTAVDLKTTISAQTELTAPWGRVLTPEQSAVLAQTIFDAVAVVYP